MKVQQTDNAYLSYDEVAQLVGVPKGTLQWWVHLKRIPHVRLGKRLVRFEADALRAWMEELRVTPKNDTNAQEDTAKECK